MESQVPRIESSFDGVVIGAGMAGLTAAARASQAGRKVLLLERDDRIGGNARTSGGYIWTASSVEEFARLAPRADARLQAAVVEEFPAVIQWIRDLGVAVGEKVEVSEGVGHKVDVHTLLRRCREIVVAAGGQVVERALVKRLVRSAAGSVSAVLYHVEGQWHAVSTPWTLLATGGYQGNASLVAEHLGTRFADLPVRSVGTCVGDGLALAQSVGAAHATASDTFYGHLVGAGVRWDDDASLRRLSLFHSDHSLLLGRDGRRFVDESRHDYVNAQEVARHCADATALMIWDERVQHDVVLAPWPPGTPGEDRFGLSLAAGAVGGVVGGSADLARWADDHGFAGQAVAETLDRYNVAVRSSEHDLAPPDAPRVAHRDPLVTAPYYVMLARAAITSPFGGIRIAPSGRALRADGSEIDGLFVAGIDAGNVMGDGYVGGLAQAAGQAFRVLRTLGVLSSDIP